MIVGKNTDILNKGYSRQNQSDRESIPKSNDHSFEPTEILDYWHLKIWQEFFGTETRLSPSCNEVDVSEKGDKRAIDLISRELKS